MYLFTRTIRMGGGDPAGAMGWSASITEQVRSITGFGVDAWASVMSPDAGTVVWSIWVEHLSEIEQGGDKLAASGDYLASVKTGQEFIDGPVVDGLSTLVHGAPDLSGDPPNYVTAAQAVAAPGRLSDAITSGIEIADHAAKLTGLPTMFVVNSTGAYGGCAWLTGCPDVDAVEHGEAALMGDPEWLKLIDRVGTAYNPDASQAIYRRIA
jgi:hypothetical protein